MNTLKRFVWIGLAILVASAGSIARADVGDQYRLSTISVQPGFSGNWIKDPTILCPWSFRAEFSGQGWHDFKAIDVDRFDFILSASPYEGLEIGADMPLIINDPEIGPEEMGIGQVSAYGKYRLVHTDLIDFVGGFEYQANSAQNEFVACGLPGQLCGYGFGKAGYNPFASVRARLGDEFAVGAHLGYEFFGSPLGNVINWDANGIWAPKKWLDLRLELTGFNQAGGPTQSIIAFQPGIDLIFDRITFRVGGSKGVSDDAADWTLGGGVAITLGKKCEEAPPPPPPPPPPAAAAPAPMKKKIVLRGVNFDFNKYNIRPVDVPVLEEAVTTLKEEGMPAIVATGYTDSIGTDAYNLKLSDRRADAVKDWLVAHGIPASKITTEGRGKADPVATNETADGRAQNRRTELKVVE